MRIALEAVGGRCVFSSEWDRYCQQTYLKNFGETPLGDITGIDAADVPRHDVIAAGFPCQPFSHAGKKLGLRDTRGTLFFDIARIAESHRPKALLLENVRGFRNHDSGRTLSVITEVLEELDYEVHSELLNAKDFGLPQNRARFFIVAIRSDLPGANAFAFPQPTGDLTRVGDILKRRVPDEYTISDRLWKGHLNRKQRNVTAGKGFGYGLVARNDPWTRTISARYGKDGSEILIEQPGRNPRMLTPREAARLQGFPDSFEIPVSDTQAYKQFGNSVPIPLVEAVARATLKAIRKS